MMSFKYIGAMLFLLALVSYQASADDTTPAAGGDDAATEPSAGGDDAAGGGDAAGGDAAASGNGAATTMANGDASGTEAPAAAEGEVTTAASGEFCEMNVMSVSPSPSLMHWAPWRSFHGYSYE